MECEDGWRGDEVVQLRNRSACSECGSRRKSDAEVLACARDGEEEAKRQSAEERRATESEAELLRAVEP